MIFFKHLQVCLHMKQTNFLDIRSLRKFFNYRIISRLTSKHFKPLYHLCMVCWEVFSRSIFVIVLVELLLPKLSAFLLGICPSFIHMLFFLVMPSNKKKFKTDNKFVNINMIFFFIENHPSFAYLPFFRIKPTKHFLARTQATKNSDFT